MIIQQIVRPRPLRWIAAGGVLAIAFCAWTLHGHDDATVASTLPLRTRAQAFDVTASVLTRNATAAVAYGDAAPPAAPFYCNAQRIEASLNGTSEPLCVGSARPGVNGSMRTYRADARDSGDNWIAVDVAGDAVIGMSIGRGGVAHHACEAAACTGITLGPLDLQGSRAITLLGVRLASSSAPAGTVAILDGRLTTAMPDAAAATAACAGQSVLVSAQGGPTHSFCPDDGIAVDNAQPQGPLYSFNSVDSIGIAVALDAEGRVRRVDQGAMSCVAPNCVGVTVTPRGADGDRRVVFNGALLQDPERPEHWAGLSGWLLLP